MIRIRQWGESITRKRNESRRNKNVNEGGRRAMCRTSDNLVEREKSEIEFIWS